MKGLVIGQVYYLCRTKHLCSFDLLLCTFFFLYFLSCKNNKDTEDEQLVSVKMDRDQEDFDLSFIWEDLHMGRGTRFFRYLLKSNIGVTISLTFYCQRLNSTLCLVCSPPEPFSTSMTDDLTFNIDQLHLLTLNSRPDSDIPTLKIRTNQTNAKLYERIMLHQ